MDVIETQQFQLWNLGIARALTAQGSEQRLQYLLEALGLLAAFDTGMVTFFGEGRKPIHLYDNAATSDMKEDIALYLKGAYLLDPYYRYGLKGQSDGVFPLEAIAPRGFRDSEYYKSYYKQSGIADEVGLLVHVDEQHFASVSLALLSADGSFAENDIARLKAALPLLEVLLKNIWQDFRAVQQEGEDLHSQLEEVLKVFGSSLLTPREQEVVQLYLYGHSTRSIAEHLDISEHTVTQHRKNCYAKLDITSQAELFALFIGSLSCLKGDLSQDPLQYYMGL